MFAEIPIDITAEQAGTLILLRRSAEHAIERLTGAVTVLAAGKQGELVDIVGHTMILRVRKEPEFSDE